MVALFSKPIDTIFYLLTAPIADDLKITTADNALNTAVRRMSGAIRRVSIVATNVANTAINNINNNTKRLFVGLSTRKIPHRTSTAHQLATASMTLLARTTIHQLEERNLDRLRAYFMSQNGNSEFVGDDDDSDSDSSQSSVNFDDYNISSSRSIRNVGDMRLKSKVEKRNNDNSMRNMTDSVNIGTLNGIEKLSREITCQRRLLKSSELEMFDQQWGID
jgi:hypothetical protein